MKKDFNVGENKVAVNVNFETGSVILGNFVFNDKTDFIYFVNKLTDIAEELLEEDK